MPRAKPPSGVVSSLLLGFILITTLLWARYQTYLEGMVFDRAWGSMWWGMLLLGIILLYIVILLSIVLSTIRRKIRWPWLLLSLTTPVLWLLSHSLPIPSFTEGMRDGLREKIPAERLYQFAEAMRHETSKIDWETHSEITNPLYFERHPLNKLAKEKFPDIHGLSAAEPRIEVGEAHVAMFWGSALVKHWGIQIGERPFLHASDEYQKGVSYQKVYPEVWVYRDRY
jgi:hypothetical protein